MLNGSNHKSNWWNMNGGPSDRPAMVYHAFNGHGSNDNGCGDIRIAHAGWSWSNLPNWQTFTKKAGCLTGNDNEIRFLIYGNHIRISKDYHGVFCIPNNNDVVFLC